ncbi:hypothetical protein Q1695_000523 [Nippostrongylus brasiliensis]|nr:hypothetical protein Q1695_000523 [Nippostrongylus brasiliensis]
MQLFSGRLSLSAPGGKVTLWKSVLCVPNISFSNGRTTYLAPQHINGGLARGSNRIDIPGSSQQLATSRF